MLKECIGSVPVFVVTGYTDMRKGIDGLAAILEGQFSLDPFNQSLFLFCGRNCRKLKGLLWEGDGFLLLSKRLDSGQYKWPRNVSEAKQLSEQQIRWLLEGLSIHQPKAIKQSVPGAIY